MDLLRLVRLVLIASALPFAAPLLISPACHAGQDEVVPTRQEPRHRGKLENASVRIVDVEIPPGDRTLFHEHAIDYAYVMIADAAMSNEVKDTPAKDLTIRAGDVGYYRSVQGAYVHRFSNIGQTVFRAIGIELLAPFAPSAVVDPLRHATGYVTVLDNERMRGHRLVLEPGQESKPVTLRAPSVRVAVTAGRIEQRSASGTPMAIDLLPAAFEYREATVTVGVKNVGDTRIELVEFEIK